MLTLPLPQLIAVDCRRQRTSCSEVRKQHRFLRGQYGGCLSHEVHTTEDDHVGFGFCRLATQAERVAYKIGDILDLRSLVVVRKNDRISLAREMPDLLVQFFVKL